MAAVQLPVYDAKGATVGSFDVDPDVIAPSISKQLLHDAVVMYQANQRFGTFATKSRGMVAGTTKKMYRQKGTGNARAGSRRAVQRRGGGHAFHKQPRDFYYRMPKKQIRLATRMALASKIVDQQLIVVSDLEFAAPKTKDFAALLKAIKYGEKTLADVTVLVATPELNKNVYLSARNITGVTVSHNADLNALSLLTPRCVLITKSALDQFVAKAKSENEAREEKRKAREEAGVA